MSKVSMRFKQLNNQHFQGTCPHKIARHSMSKGWDSHKITPQEENGALQVRDSYPRQANTASLNPASEKEHSFLHY